LRHLARALDAAGLRYFVTGSTATILYGEPRFTNDIDVVVDLSESAIADFCSRFPPEEFYVSESAAREAVRNKSQFNIIHPSSGLKADLMVPELTPFNKSRFDRARRIRPEENFEVSFASPEDTILKKMEFYRLGGSEKHLRDITGVLTISRDQLDFGYLNRWAQEMGLADLWTAIQNRAAENR
jgi:nucleotidyltransferase AbiEii toxin of type IV toxin-antitoxin system